MPVLAEACAAAEKARVNATAIRPQIDQVLGNRLRTRRLTLRQAVFRVCALADSPLSVQEVWDSAVRHGAKSKAKNPLTSVHRALKAHPLVKPIADGRWQITALVDHGEHGRVADEVALAHDLERPVGRRVGLARAVGLRGA